MVNWQAVARVISPYRLPLKALAQRIPKVSARWHAALIHLQVAKAIS